jgi:hypothetical protein
MSAYLSVCPPACLSVRDDDCTVNNRAHLLILQIHDCGIVVAAQHSLKSCGIASADVRPSSCGIAIADLRKVAHAHL